jgi:hypothetical protein
MPLIVADPVISFLRHRAHTEEYGHHADYRYPYRKIRGHKGSLNGTRSAHAELDVMTSRDGRCGRASSGFPATRIRRSACHRESHEAPVIEFNYRGSGCPCSLPCGCGGLRGGPPQSTLLPLGNKEDDQWPGQLRPSLRSASASRSTGICRLSSDPAAFARS